MIYILTQQLLILHYKVNRCQQFQQYNLKMQKKYTEQYNRTKIVNDINNYKSTYKNLLNKDKPTSKLTTNYQKNQKLKQEYKLYQSKQPKSKDMNRLQQQNQRKYSQKCSQYGNFPSSQLNSPKSSYQINDARLQKNSFSKSHLNYLNNKKRHFNYNSCQKLKSQQITDRQECKIQNGQIKGYGKYQKSEKKGSQTKKQKSINYFAQNQKTPQIQNNYSQSAQNFVSNFKYQASKQNTPNKKFKHNKMEYCPISSAMGSRKQSLSFLQSINSTINLAQQNQNDNNKNGNSKKQSSDFIKQYSINKKIAKGQIQKSSKHLHLNTKAQSKKSHQITLDEIKKSVQYKKNSKHKELTSIQYQYHTNKTKSTIVKSQMAKSQAVSRKNSQNCQHKTKNDSYYQTTTMSKEKLQLKNKQRNYQNQQQLKNNKYVNKQTNNHYSNLEESHIIQGNKHNIKQQSSLKKGNHKNEKTFQYSGQKQIEPSQFLVFDQIQLKQYMKGKKPKKQRCTTHQNSNQTAYATLSMNRYQTDRQHKKTAMTKISENEQNLSHFNQKKVNLNSIFQRMKITLEAYQTKQINWNQQKQIYLSKIKQLQQKLIRLANPSQNNTTNASEASKHKNKPIVYIQEPEKYGYNISKQNKQKLKTVKKQTVSRHKYSYQY